MKGKLRKWSVFKERETGYIWIVTKFESELHYDAEIFRPYGVDGLWQVRDANLIANRNNETKREHAGFVEDTYIVLNY